jgi:hypothetical protein
MNGTTAPTTTACFDPTSGLFICQTCEASYFLEAEMDAHLTTHPAPEMIEGCNAEGQETFGPAAARPAQTDAPADECRWTRDYMDRWVVRGPARLMVEGTTVLVTSRKGTKPVKLGPVEADARTRWDSEPMAIAPEVREAPERPAQQTAPAPAGRIEITGTVLIARLKSSQYGDVIKLRVLDDRGFAIWGNAPQAFLGEVGYPHGELVSMVEPGDRVTFVATIKPSDDDETFGFFSRASKARQL